MVLSDINFKIMSFIATLTIDDIEYKVLKCHFGIEQAIAQNGMATQNPRGGVIHVELESSESTELYHWMVTPNLLKNGNVTFFRRDAMSRMKRLDFTDALCVNYDEYFVHDGNTAMLTKITISARETVLEDVTVSNNWTIV